MTAAQHTLAEAVLLNVCQKNPHMTPEQLSKELLAYGISKVNVSWIKRVFREWQYSHKRFYYVQIHKMTQKNILRYIDHIFGIVEIDPEKLKYLDESRFETKSNHTRIWYQHKQQTTQATNNIW